jgi:DNA-binding IclR family transcriptional regulator
MRRNVGSVDLETGEVLPGTFVYVEGRAKIKEAWFMGFHEGFRALAREKRLQGQPLRVLLALMGRLDFENWMLVSQKEIAEDLGLSASRISEAMRVLTDLGIIEKGPAQGTAKSYRLTPGYGWRGSVYNFHKARRAQLLKVVK